MAPDTLKPVYREVLAQADKCPEKPAIIVGGTTFSYGALAEAVGNAAGALRSRYDIAPGERVVVLASPGFEFIRTYLAVHSIGAVCVPLDPNVAAGRLGDIAERVSPKLLVGQKTKLVSGTEKAKLSAGEKAKAVSGTEKAKEKTKAVSGTEKAKAAQASFADLAEAGHDGRPGRPVDIDVAQTADLMFTTGTTGRSKGVVLSHRALAVACSHINAFIGLESDDIEVLPLPLGHSFGLGRVRCVLSLGATLVLVPGFVSAARILEAMSSARATGLASVPAGLGILLGDTGEALRRHGSRLRYVEIGSSSMPMEHKKQLMSALPNARICMHYGLTEASRSAYLSFHDDAEKLESIGRPSPGVDMRIVDESGAEIRDGSEGQIEVRGGHLMSGYWQDAALTRDSLHDGWLRTGDLGRRDADGYYYLKARASDIINVGGRKVSPQEIEAILTSHPAVAECACVGIPDEQGLSGEMISAWLVADPGVSELPGFPELASLLRRSLESYKIPRRFTWIAELPKSASGKLLRRKLRDAESA